MVLAKDQAFGFQIVLGQLKFLREADRAVVGSLHQPELPLDTTRHDVDVDRHERMRDHHVDGQIQLVEHQTVGLGGVVLDREDRADLLAHGTITEHDGGAPEGDTGIGHVFRNHAKA